MSVCAFFFFFERMDGKDDIHWNPVNLANNRAKNSKTLKLRLSDGRDSTKIRQGTSLLSPHAFFALVSSIHAFPNILEPGTGSIVRVCLNLPD